MPFENKEVRRLWDQANEKWLFSVVDVIGILSKSADPRNYWKVLKNRLKKEGSEVVTNCNQLKLKASDGKHYLTDVADTETVLRLIQSVPSPKAEPIKLWLAKVGSERIEEFKFRTLRPASLRVFAFIGTIFPWIRKARLLKPQR